MQGYFGSHGNLSTIVTTLVNKLIIVYNKVPQMLKTICHKVAALQGQNVELHLQLDAANTSNWAVAEAMDEDLSVFHMYCEKTLARFKKATD